MRNSTMKKIACGLLILGILLNCCACAGTYLPTTMLKIFFSTAVSAEQAARKADPENLSPHPISLLDDRIFIQMPEGATHPTDYQKKLLHVPETDRLDSEDEVIWAGSNEIIMISAIESFRLAGEDWIGTQVNNVDGEQLRLDETVSTQFFETDKKNRYSLDKNYYHLLTVHVKMPDQSLIALYFSCYTLGGTERIDFFYDLSQMMARSITSGRTLDMRAHTVEWEGITFGTQEGYYVGKPKKKPWFRENGEKYELIAYKMMPNNKHCRIYMSIVSSAKVKEDWGNVKLKPDVILNQQMEWQYISDDFGVRAVGIVSIGNGKSLKVSMVAPNEQIAQELFDIVHTLKKK